MTVKSSLLDMKNAVLDLQIADHDTFARPLRRLAQTLASDDLKHITDRLKAQADFEAFLAGGSGGGSMVGSASLDWPTDREQELGLTIALIERGAEDPNWLTDFAFTYYYGGNRFVESIRKLVGSVIVPFNRDFAVYVDNSRASGPPVQDQPSDFERVFIVHGHDEGPKEAVARFVTGMGLEPVILHEQASRGMTVLEKLIANGDVGYAIVLLTPDDLGRTGWEEGETPRARQNVILELGYFLGRLGRDRVIAILKDNVEIPSDYMGVVYAPFDDHGAWRLTLVREMQAAGYAIDMNEAMR